MNLTLKRLTVDDRQEVEDLISRDFPDVEYTITDDTNGLNVWVDQGVMEDEVDEFKGLFSQAGFEVQDLDESCKGKDRVYEARLDRFGRCLVCGQRPALILGGRFRCLCQTGRVSSKI